MEREIIGVLAGFVIATITAPVGVSGAVFLLPVQMSVLNVYLKRMVNHNHYLSMKS